MTVYKLTPEQAESLRDSVRPDGSRYNVAVLDADSNIIISHEQYADCGLGEPIPYNPREVEGI